MAAYEGRTARESRILCPARGLSTRQVFQRLGAQVQIPAHVDYAARALIDLAQHRVDGLIRSSEIASRCALSETFLQQVLLRLRRAGLIRSTRGPSGGHTLTRAPETITLGDLFRALGEAPLTVSCMHDGRCTVLEGCMLKNLFCELVARHSQLLDAITLADLVRRVAERDALGSYSI